MRYVVVGFALAGLFLWVYALITPWREFTLIRAGNSSAAIALVGALLGFCLPLANTIAHSVSLADVVLWSGDPFSVYTKAERVYNEGRLVFDRNDPAHQLQTDFNLGITAPGIDP